MRTIDNLVLLAHAAYDFRTRPEADAFLYGIKVSRKPESWLLVTSAIDIRRLGQPLKSKLFSAIERGDAEAVQELMENGLTPNVRAPNGLTALQTAALKGQAQIAFVLISHGAKANLTTNNGLNDTALHLSAESFSPESQKLASELIKADADIDAFNSKGQTPLMIALEKDNLPLALHLLNNGAKLDYSDENGNTARSIFISKFDGIVSDPLIDKFQEKIVSYDALQEDRKTKNIKSLNATPYPSPYKN